MSLCACARRITRIVFLFLLPALPLIAAGRRAVIVGIDDYSASTLPRAVVGPLAPRSLPTLGGAAGDALLMRDMIIKRRGFLPADITVLTNQQATRIAILAAIERRLVAPAAPGDVLLFYFGGHGSQVFNSLSEEPDQMDETVVPADARAGATDIRDKELRRLFNRILDHGARLTLIFDSCHSGSIARGVPAEAPVRGVEPDRRPLADSAPAGPRPEDRGALVLTAAHDFDNAYEMRDEQHQSHGAFTWAWMRALRDAPDDEPAAETFLRAKARLSVDRPEQQPAMAGDAASRRTPFLGTRDGHTDGSGIVVQSVAGSVAEIDGGWANGITVGSELQPARDPASPLRLQVTSLSGLVRCTARVNGAAQSVTPGLLLRVASWAAPPARPLRVWIGRDSAMLPDLNALREAAARRQIRWIDDPSETTPAFVLRARGAEWELITANHTLPLGARPSAASIVERVKTGTSLFVQLPPPPPLIDELGLTHGTEKDGVERTLRPLDADYLLLGRAGAQGTEVAWVRPRVDRRDGTRTVLPLRTHWEPAADAGLAAAALKDALRSLRRIHGWQELATPPGCTFPYRLALRRARGGRLVTGTTLTGREEYSLVLRATTPPRKTAPRYVYVFMVDSDGRSLLLYPRPEQGSVESHFPLRGTAPAEIALGTGPLLRTSAPYGMDTYFLLTTDQPLSDALLLEADGVREDIPPPQTPLEELLALGVGGRSGQYVTPANWSIERLAMLSVPPAAARRESLRGMNEIRLVSDTIAAMPADPLEKIGPLLTSGRAAEARPLLRQAVERYRAEKQLNREALALLLLGMADAGADDMAAARGDLQESATKLQQAGDPLGAWMALSSLAHVERNLDNLTAALAAHRHALAVIHDADAPDAPFTLDTILLLAPAFGMNPDILGPMKSQMALLKPVFLHSFAEPLTRDALAGILIETDRLDEAENELRSASAASAMFGGMFDSSIEAHMGHLRRRQHRYDEARESYKKALAAPKMALPGLDAQRTDREILSALAMMEVQAGRLDDALAWNDQALQRAREAKNPGREAFLTEERGELLTNGGRYDDAQKVLEGALVLAATDPARRASIEHTLGALNLFRGNYGDAAIHLEKSIALYHQVKDDYSEAGVWTILAEVYVTTSMQGAGADAVAHAKALAESSGFRSAQAFVPLLEAMQHLVAGKATPQEMNAALDAWAKEPATAEVEDASTMYPALRAILSGAGGKTASTSLAGGSANPILAGMEYMVEGRRLFQAGDPAGARERWLKGLQANPSKDLRVGYLALVGATYWKEGDAAQAIRYFTDAAQAMEVPIDGLHSDEMLAGYLGGERHAYYDVVVELLAKQGRFDEAFSVAERARARAFLRLIGNSRLRGTGGADAALVREAESLRLEIVEQEGRLGGGSNLAEKRSRYEALLGRVQAANPEYTSLTRVEPLSLDAICADLPPDTTLVSYFVSPLNAHAWVLDHDAFTHVTLPLTPPQRKRILCWATALQRPSRDNTRGGVPITDCGSEPTTAGEAYDALIAPLREKIHTSRLIVMPYGDLHYVPFAALRDPKSGRYLIEDFTLLLAPSASALRFLRAKETPVTGTALVLGDPATASLDALSGARREALRVAEAFGTRAKIGADAAESVVKHLHGEADLLHIAAHASYDSAHPLFSRISLAAGGGEDGNLNVDEVLSSVDLSGVNLVVLSACRSGVGRTSGGDDVVGLTRALLYAGSPGVISTLWNIDDQATVTLMDELYTRLLAGAPVADALRAAQLSLLHGTDTNHADPHYWAAFTLNGDPQGRWSAPHKP
jgi:tetratricopeptide (TPR) repeat protein